FTDFRKIWIHTCSLPDNFKMNVLRNVSLATAIDRLGGAQSTPTACQGGPYDQRKKQVGWLCRSQPPFSLLCSPGGRVMCTRSSRRIKMQSSENEQNCMTRSSKIRMRFSAITCSLENGNATRPWTSSVSKMIPTS